MKVTPFGSVPEVRARRFCRLVAAAFTAGSLEHAYDNGIVWSWVAGAVGFLLLAVMLRPRTQSREEDSAAPMPDAPMAPLAGFVRDAEMAGVAPETKVGELLRAPSRPLP